MSVDLPDESTLIEDLLASLPSEGSEREGGLQQAARYLGNFGGRGKRPLTPHLEEIALRLTHEALFELYQGFRLGTFYGVSRIARPPREPPAAQIRLRERLEALSSVEAARHEMFRWFLAGLRHELGHILSERLRTPPRTRRPKRLFMHGVARLAFALEQALRTPVDEQNPEHEFGLYGLHLLLAYSGEIRSHEFQALCELLGYWVEAYPKFPEQEIRDLVCVMALAALSPAQVRELVTHLLSWRDLERYPAERCFPSRRAEVQARAWADGYGWAYMLPAVMLSPFLGSLSLPALFGEGYKRYRQEINRRMSIASALASLASHEADCIPTLIEDIDTLLDRQADVEAMFVVMDALPAFLLHPSHLPLLLETLSRHDLHEFDRLWVDDLRKLYLTISEEALAALLDLLRRFPEVRWPLQILENTGELASQAEEWLGRQVQDGKDDLPIEVALALYRRSSALRQPSALQSALWGRLKRYLREGVPVPDGLVRWLLNLPDEALRRLLLDLVRQLGSSLLQTTDSIFIFLRAIAVEVNHTERPNAVKLAACWLVDPDDELETGLPLAERLRWAAKLLTRHRLDAEIADLLARVIPQVDSEIVEQDSWNRSPVKQQVVANHPRQASVLLEGMTRRQEYPMRAGADRRLALVRALGWSASPKYALPLLAEIMELAAELRIAWSEAGEKMWRYFPEFGWESDALVIETLKGVVRLEPVLPQAVALLEEILLAEYKMPEGGFEGALASGTIAREVLPLLVNRRLANEAIRALVALLEHDHPLEEQHIQRVWQCALQWLSNTSRLSTEQQEIVWRVGYASLLILTRALALLVLGRQRPLSGRTWNTVMALLRTPWRQLYRDRSAEIARLPNRSSWFILGPGDVFLLAGAAVAVTAEWAVDTGLLTDEEQRVLRKAWSQAASDLNRIWEARLAVSTHPLTGKDWSYAKGLALSLCHAVGYTPDADPDWLIRPADLARNVRLIIG